MKIKNIKIAIYVFVMVSVQFMFVQAAEAEIFKCENIQGKVFYNEKPCPVNEKETELKPVKDPKNGYIPPTLIEKKETVVKQGVIVGDEEQRVIEKLENRTSERQETGVSNKLGESDITKNEGQNQGQQIDVGEISASAISLQRANSNGKKTQKTDRTENKAVKMNVDRYAGETREPRNLSSR